LGTTGDGNNNDCNGHGTHVAGTIGSTDYGVAKEVNLVAVKVLNCDGSGSNSGVIAGLNWVAQNCTTPKNCTANMSLGGSKSNAVNNAATALVKKGVTLVVAAGNDNKNAANYSPSSTATAITVGAVDNTDTRAYFSNFGSVVDIFAPGVGITSTWIGGTTNTISGTSMATPHVCGLVARYLSEAVYTPATVQAKLLFDAQTGAVKNCPSKTPNKLLRRLCV